MFFFPWCISRLSPLSIGLNANAGVVLFTIGESRLLTPMVELIRQFLTHHDILPCFFPSACRPPVYLRQTIRGYHHVEVNVDHSFFCGSYLLRRVHI